jgi:SagB-type dehydrogenase family enzyme
MSVPSLTALHTYLRDTHFKQTAHEMQYAEQNTYPVLKKYVRMPQIQLPPAVISSTTLAEACTLRKSQKSFGNVPISLETVSFILKYSQGVSDTGNRTYPSAGQRYPIETYLITKHITSLTPGVYHYRSDTHALEHLWNTAHDFRMDTSPKDLWVHDAAAIFLFTALWERSTPRYHTVAFEFTLIEAGHLGQNVLLCAAASHLSACPWGGFRDGSISELLDINPEREQCVYTVAIGSPPATQTS